MGDDVIKRSDAVVAIANLHVSHDREEIFKAYAKNPHSMTTDFEGTLIDAINAVEAVPSAEGRYIDADALVTVCLYDDEHEEDYTECMSIGKCLDLLTEEGCPNPVGRPQGEWIWHEDEDICNCSECEFEIDATGCIEPMEYVGVFHYCPNCGARMEGDKDD